MRCYYENKNEITFGKLYNSYEADRFCKLALDLNKIKVHCEKLNYLDRIPNLNKRMVATIFKY